MLKEAEEQRLEVLAAAGRYVSYNMCVCSYNCVCRFFSSTIGLPPLYNCVLLWAFFDNMCAAEYVCRVHFNQWSASLLFMSPCEPLALKTKREYDNQDFLCAIFIPFWPFDDPLRLIFYIPAEFLNWHPLCRRRRRWASRGQWSTTGTTRRCTWKPSQTGSPSSSRPSSRTRRTSSSARCSCGSSRRDAKPLPQHPQFFLTTRNPQRTWRWDEFEFTVTKGHIFVGVFFSYFKA